LLGALALPRRLSLARLDSSVSLLGLALGLSAKPLPVLALIGGLSSQLSVLMENGITQDCGDRGSHIGVDAIERESRRRLGAGPIAG
jgi:hypothetical protein